MIKHNDNPMNNNFWYLFTQLISQLAQMHKKINIAITKWEQHFNKLQHGLIFDENNPDMTDTFENENCNKKLIQNDTGSSQNKSHDKYKTHSLDEYVENMVKKLWAIPKHLNIGKKKTLDVQPEIQKFPHETFNTKNKTAQKNECQKFCLCSQGDIWDSEKENITDLGLWKICDHCKRHHELCFNYNSENNSSSWGDMMENDLKWNKQENLDDENQKTTHNIDFFFKKTLCSNDSLILKCCKGGNGYRREIRTF